MNNRPFLPLAHLDRMTDCTGLIQHAIYGVPRRDSGYTTDDNARALRLCTRIWDGSRDDRQLARVVRYLGFLEHARRPGGGFHNFMSYQRDWLDDIGSADCQGQAALGLAEVVASRLPTGVRDLARELLAESLPVLATARSLRAQSYVLQAYVHLWRNGVDELRPLEAIALTAAEWLVERFERVRTPNWRWFESRLTYANAALPHSLFDAAERWDREEFLSIAEESFEFLESVTTVHDMFWPIGNQYWYHRDEEKSLYDQQPVEAATMAGAALAGLRVVGSSKYLTAFHRAHAWFHGRNSLNCSMVDAACGACYDGLHSTGTNKNLGAESTLAYLWTEQHPAAAPAEGAEPYCSVVARC